MAGILLAHCSFACKACLLFCCGTAGTRSSLTHRLVCMQSLSSHLLHDCRNISESMKGLWKNSTTRRSQVSASLMDKPKVCSYCGTVGHNRRGCPKLHPQKQHTEKVRPSASIQFQVLTFMQHVHRKLSQNQFRELSCQQMEAVCMLGCLQHVQHLFMLSTPYVAHTQDIDKNVGCAKFAFLRASALVTHMCIIGSSGC